MKLVLRISKAQFCVAEKKVNRLENLAAVLCSCSGATALRCHGQKAHHLDGPSCAIASRRTVAAAVFGSSRCGSCKDRWSLLLPFQYFIPSRCLLTAYVGRPLSAVDTLNQNVISAEFSSLG